MIRVNQLKLPVGHSQEELMGRLARELRIPREKIKSCEIWKKSIDARKKPIQYVYTMDVEVEQEEKLLKSSREIEILGKRGEASIPFRSPVIRHCLTDRSLQAAARRGCSAA